MLEYKVIPAPRKAQKNKGAKGTAERYSLSLQATLNDMAANGWSFVRAETLPVDVPQGLFRKAVEEFHTVLVFTRPKLAAQKSATSDESAEIESRRPVFFAEKETAKSDGPKLGPATGEEASETPKVTAEKKDADAKTATKAKAAKSKRKTSGKSE